MYVKKAHKPETVLKSVQRGAAQDQDCNNFEFVFKIMLKRISFIFGFMLGHSENDIFTVKAASLLLFPELSSFTLKSFFSGSVKTFTSYSLSDYILLSSAPLQH